MKNERNVGIQESGQEVKHKYRLNKRKFSIVLALFCFITAAVIITAQYLNSAEGKEAIAGLDPPNQTEVNSPTVYIDSEYPLEGKIIIVDAGHGGDDPGAIGINGSVESELNLIVAFLLKEQMESKGAEVVMTRSDETSPAKTNEEGWKEKDWKEREKIILESGADAVISVHMNRFEDSSVSGPLVIFLPGSPQGKRLAETIQRSMNEILDPEIPGIARAECLRILKYGSQPSVLVECGYISNPQEEEKLNTEDYQNKVAKAVSDGIIIYFLNN
jgi:N-acetylmuramoyl-L-alanine amidase